jgi:type IX secretion system PorP/SprF family membrane protein
MNRFTLPLFWLLLCTPVTLFSQQHRQGVYRYERQLIHNPAYAGYGNESRALLHYRNQWVGVEGAPEQAALAFDGSLRDHKVGWGALVYNENTNMISKTACYGVYRYRLHLKEKHRLDMGFSLGIMQHRLDFQKVHAADYDDEALLKHRETGSMPDASLGLMYRLFNWEVAVAVAHPFFNKSRYYNHQGEGELHYQLVPHYFLDTRYRYFLSQSLALEPALHLGTVQGMPLQVMGSLYLNYDSRYWMGMTYTHTSGLGVAFGMQCLEYMTLAYLYDYGIAHLRAYHGGSHEVMIGLALGAFAGGEGGTARHMGSISRSEAEYLSLLRAEQAMLKEEMQASEKQQRQQQEELQRLRDIMVRERDTIEVYIEKYRIGLEELAALDFSREGENKEFFLVLGAYYRLQDAAFFQQILQRDLGLDTRVFQRGDGKYFFVYYQGYRRNEDTLEQIHEAIKSLHEQGIEQYINGNLWLYRVVE